MLIDSHAHLTFPSISDQVEGMLERAQSAGMSRIVCIATNPSELEAALLLSQRYPWVAVAAATTPHDVDQEGEEVFPFIAQKARERQLVAIGETGLDYHYTHSDKLTQQQFLRRYLHLALECQLPVIIHCREAFADFFSILDREYRLGSGYGPGVLHCFTGTLDEAYQVIERGWYLSFSGIVTFKKSHELREVAKMIPLDQILIETDTPYLAPQSHRGQQNEPSYLVETARCIAEAKGISFEELAEATSKNALNLFDL